MPVRSAKDGLLKHELMLSVLDPEDTVLTFWTYRVEDPVPAARVTYEQDQINAWLSSHWAAITANYASAVRIKTWDFGTSPPTKKPTKFIVPVKFGTQAGATAPPSSSVVVALRTQPVNSAVRNRNNGRLAHPALTTVSFSTVSIPTAANVLAAYTNLLTRLTLGAHADVGQWSVVSFFEPGGAARVDPQVTAINHVLVRTQVGTQRRRYRKVGPYPRGA